MKISRRNLRKIIAEAINLPDVSADELDMTDMDDADLGGDWDTGDDFDATTASMQLPKTAQYNYDGNSPDNYLARKYNAKTVDRFEARKINDQIHNDRRKKGLIGKPSQFSASLKDAIKDAYLLVDGDIDSGEFRRYVSGREDDSQGRPILVVMASNEETIVAKDRDRNPATGRGPSYYIIENDIF